MTRRLLLALVQLLAVVLLALVLAGALQWFLGAAPADAFFAEGPALMFTFMDVGLVLWVLLLVLGAIRGRGLGFGLGGGLIAAVVAAVVNLVVVIVIALLQGGANLFDIALGVEAGILFLVAWLLAVPVVLRVARSRNGV